MKRGLIQVGFPARGGLGTGMNHILESTVEGKRERMMAQFGLQAARGPKLLDLKNGAGIG